MPRLSLVIPVYQGEKTLDSLLEEIWAVKSAQEDKKDLAAFEISEVILVHDCGPDDSAGVIRSLAAKYEFIQPVWLSRNYGQHAATLAGMASSRGDWIVTLDEDGQHDPRDISSLFDAATYQDLDVVYAKPINPAPHGPFRNLSSKFAKKLLSKVARAGDTSNFQSYRLILGSLGRSVSAYVGSEVYLDVAVSWVTTRVGTAPVTLRVEGDRPSGYSLGKLLSHFWRMFLTSGTRGLRFVSFLGLLFSALGLAATIYILMQKIISDTFPAGWASMTVLVLFSSGAILFSLGIIAEYIGISVGMAMGKPPYLIVEDRYTESSGRTK